jgi:hypothetical protein
MRAKTISDRITRHSFMSSMIAEYVELLDSESEKNLNTVIANFSNQFIGEFEEMIEGSETASQWGRHATIMIETSESKIMFVKVLVSLDITPEEVHIYSFIVHPEEADILLQCSLGDRYDDVYSEL